MICQTQFRRKCLLLGLVLLIAWTSALETSADRENERFRIGEPATTKDVDGRLDNGQRYRERSWSEWNDPSDSRENAKNEEGIGTLENRRRPKEENSHEDIFPSSAGNGRELKKARGEDEDEKKTLSQQVKEGKYGLIQNEIYEKAPRRPGVISYSSNPEVPKDTIDNFGGLNKDDIWLAENHLLVLKGGNFPKEEANSNIAAAEAQQTWPPIDDYEAPKRQVKIPANPKVPPPFVVQLKDGGPFEIIGFNDTERRRIDPKLNSFERENGDALPLDDDEPLFVTSKNNTYEYRNNSTRAHDYGEEERKTERAKQPSPFFYGVAPVFVLPPSNNTNDYDDDEDQSIYYPPPYSFFYKSEKSAAVPPGPLVPGIILPPPPDFFAPLDDKQEKKGSTKKQTKPLIVTSRPKIRPTYIPPRKTFSAKRNSARTTPKTITRKYTRKPHNTQVYKLFDTSTVSDTTEEVTTVSSEHDGSTTTPLPQQQHTVVERKERKMLEQRVSTWSTPLNDKYVSTTWNDYPSTTPLSTTEPVETTENTVTPTSGTFRVEVTSSPAPFRLEVTPDTVSEEGTTANQPEKIPSRALYYFYQDPTDNTDSSTVAPSATPTIEYQTNTETPYYVRKLTQQPTGQKHVYSIHTDELKENFRDYNVPTPIETPQIYEYNRPELSHKSHRYDSVPTRESNQRTLTDETPVFYDTIPNYRVLTSTTPSSASYSIKQVTKPKPIYQYSFEAADYSKRADSNRYHNLQAQRVTQSRYTNPSGSQYDYRTRAQGGDNFAYKNQRLVYPSTTVRPVPNVTPNSQYAYFTRQDEKLLDNVTKQYFTMFGKKLSSEKNTPSTTPIYEKASTVTERPSFTENTYVSNNYNVAPESEYKNEMYDDAQVPPPDLKNDIRINYQKYRPPINPDSEYVDIFNPNVQEGPRYERLQQQVNRPISLKDDILVNYRDPRPPINPDAEFIDPIAISRTNVQAENPNAYYSYGLPGDGGHVYFLTPQALPRRQEEIVHGGYLYPKPTGPRFERRRRNNGNV